MKEFVQYCKDYLTENLPEFEGESWYLDDLGFGIMQGPNADGTLTYSRARALDYLKEWWMEAADYFDWETYAIGDHRNPFENPEAYMVCMVIEGVRSLLDRAVKNLGLQDQGEVELTAELIEKLRKEIEEMYVEKLF